LEESQLAADSRRPGAPEDVRLGQYLNEMVNRIPSSQRAVTDDIGVNMPLVEDPRLAKLERLVVKQDLQLKELKSSTSWRATVPLRWAKQYLLDFKKKFSA
jgi:hypothetical protein